MTVLNDRTGQEVDWSQRLDPTMSCRWSRTAINGKQVRGSLRTIAHFEQLDERAMRRYNTHFTVIQPPYNTSVPASAGTHDYDCCVDWYLPGVDWWETQRWSRSNGLAGWYRYPPTFPSHMHSFTIPALNGGKLSWTFATKVGIYVPGQLADYYNHAFGLSGLHTPNSDKSWYPKSIAATVFDLDRYIQRKREEDMEYKDWSEASKNELVQDILNAPLNIKKEGGDKAFEGKDVRWALKQASKPASSK